MQKELLIILGLYNSYLNLSQSCSSELIEKSIEVSRTDGSNFSGLG